MWRYSHMRTMFYRAIKIYLHDMNENLEEKSQLVQYQRLIEDDFTESSK